MRLLGPELICSDAIDDICNIYLQTIASIEDIKYLLRTALQIHFFTVLMCVVKDAPKPKQRRY